MFEDALFDRLPMEQPNRVHGAALAESIDAADALLEPQRIPRQLEIDHEPAAMMQIESLARGIGRDEHIDAPSLNASTADRRQIGRHTAVNRGCSPRSRAAPPRSRRACRGIR